MENIVVKKYGSHKEADDADVEMYAKLSSAESIFIAEKLRKSIWKKEYSENVRYQDVRKCSLKSFRDVE